MKRYFINRKEWVSRPAYYSMELNQELCDYINNYLQKHLVDYKPLTFEDLVIIARYNAGDVSVQEADELQDLYPYLFIRYAETPLLHSKPQCYRLCDWVWDLLSEMLWEHYETDGSWNTEEWVDSMDELEEDE